MKIHYEQSGGYAGLKLDAMIDSDSLPLNEARSLAKIIDESNFFSISPITQSPRGADYIRYKIMVEIDEDKKHTVETTDVTTPVQLKTLIQYLTKKSISEKMRKI